MASQYDDRSPQQERDLPRTDRHHETPPAVPPSVPPTTGGGDGMMAQMLRPRSTVPDLGAQPMPPDQIGDIPPPPIPRPPAGLQGGPGLGVGGAPGLEGSTFARPDSRGIRPFQSAGPRFGPGVPFSGSGGSGGVGGDMGLSPEEAEELMRGLAMGLQSRGSEG